ncbi:uncharacterized protein PV07_08826 [Cladophialophora immunda]|uniref:Uncharacterized protein n=1 Tax=Cladophialophora immunda TaxID=569365 RepID=A0A0D2C5B5_9EURO|nr:uncharacterized protein PV07_08826 [Cladophialophora immunda]KIW25665.1 hypothetical protein PV07_08826 [Cladophialophora immunda]OQU96366.1 hypothetical protein CLAIMM_02460 [Cladophialophora immunda]
MTSTVDRTQNVETIGTRLAELKVLDDKSAYAEHLYREALAQWDDFQAVAREVQATCRATSSWNRELADVFDRHILQVRLILQTTDACKQQLREQDQALQERTRQLQTQAESIARLKALHVDLEHRFQTESIATLKAQYADLEHRFRTLVRDGPWTKEEEDDTKAQLGNRAN